VSQSVSIYTFSTLGGGEWPDATWGYANATWPFIRLSLGPEGVRFAPALISNFLIFRIPTWTADWGEVSHVDPTPGPLTIVGGRLAFHTLQRKRWTFYATGGIDPILAVLRAFRVRIDPDPPLPVDLPPIR
jgi:hypothetical protein